MKNLRVDHQSLEDDLDLKLFSYSVIELLLRGYWKTGMGKREPPESPLDPPLKGKWDSYNVCTVYVYVKNSLHNLSCGSIRIYRCFNVKSYLLRLVWFCWQSTNTLRTTALSCSFPIHHACNCNYRSSHKHSISCGMPAYFHNRSEFWYTPILCVFEQGRLWRVCTTAQTCLTLRCSTMW